MGSFLKNRSNDAHDNLSMPASDQSYSSGTSRTSTRDTSPDSFIPPDPTLNTNAGPEPSTGSRTYDVMERNSFDSVNHRRNKINDRSTSQQQVRGGPVSPTSMPRGLNAVTWRTTPAAFPMPTSLAFAVNAAMYSSSATHPDTGGDSPSRSNTSSQDNGGATLVSPSSTLSAASYINISPTRSAISGDTPIRRSMTAASRGEDQPTRIIQAAPLGRQPEPSLNELSVNEQLDQRLGEVFAYCYDRGNGQYTRLIPADMLPALKDIPTVTKSAEGMIVLPQPRGLAPNGRSSNTEVVQLQQPRVPLSPSEGSTYSVADPIQSHIDSIVALSPTPAPPKRPKIFCDKWVHEGVCAFTQQGCKYKHEMPLDRATQHSLGLFHGLPQWWKKQQAELARQREPVDPCGNDSVAVSRNIPIRGAHTTHAVSAWRRGGGSSGGELPPDAPGYFTTVAHPSAAPAGHRQGVSIGHGAEQSPGGDGSRGLVAQFRSHPTATCQYGPIGPPPRKSLPLQELGPSDPTDSAATSSKAA